MDSDIAAFKAQPKGFATKAIHVGQDPEQWASMAVIPPIVTSTTFKQEAPAKHKVHIYVQVQWIVVLRVACTRTATLGLFIIW